MKKVIIAALAAFAAVGALFRLGWQENEDFTKIFEEALRIQDLESECVADETAINPAWV